MRKSIIGLIVLLMVFPIFGATPPSAHDVTGIVYYPGGSQVASGTPIRIFNSETNETIDGTTGNGPPSYSGWFSYVIDATDGDTMIVRAWNKTNYAELTYNMTSVTLNLTLNLTRPAELNISVVEPLNDSLFNISDTIVLNLSVDVMGGLNATDCNFTLSLNESIVSYINKVHDYSSISAGSFFYEIWNLTPVNIGSTDLVVNVTCDTDALSFYNLTDTIAYNITVQDLIPPNITIIYPEYNSHKNYSNLIVLYNVSDHLNISNCTIQFNNSLNYTDIHVENKVLNNFSVNLGEGKYAFNISCYDMSWPKNKGFSGNTELTIDLTNPELFAVLPSNGSNFNRSDTVRVSLNATDNFNLSHVEINISWQNSTFNENLSAITADAFGNGYYELNFTNTSYLGRYNFTLTAYDGADRQNLTKGFFNVLGVDFFLNSSSVLFSSTAVEFSVVNLSTRVFVDGNKNTSNVNVSFYEGSYASGTYLGSDSFDFNGESYLDVAYAWTAKIGITYIDIVVDPPIAQNGSYAEFNESNNVFGINITVKAYHIFFGNASYSIILDQTDNLSFQSWNGNQEFEGNLYAVDADSNIGWSSLEPLGQTTLGALAFEDFAELDTALNMSGLNDSINRSYTAGGSPKAKQNFSVFGSTLTDVPVINSTQTSAFVTGILWDSSDGGQSYNGSQDVVFVSNFNSSQVGAYGTYDYELRVPARLRQYVSPNLDNTITLLVEVT